MLDQDTSEPIKFARRTSKRASEAKNGCSLRTDAEMDWIGWLVEVHIIHSIGFIGLVGVHNDHHHHGNGQQRTGRPFCCSIFIRKSPSIPFHLIATSQYSCVLDSNGHGKGKQTDWPMVVVVSINYTHFTSFTCAASC